MTTISVSPAGLVVRIEGFDRILAFKRQIAVPLTHVAGVRIAERDARRWFRGLRLLGTDIPGVIVAGSYFWNGRLTFWDVHDARNAIAIALRDERYAELVVEVADPAAATALIRAALETKEPA